MTCSFQSTLPRGERLVELVDFGAFALVSIHAPAWGATRAPLPSAASAGGFNPRSRVGSDALPLFRGRWSLSFNPRSRVGSDAVRRGVRTTRETVSIHAPAWGATSTWTR